MTSTSNDPPTPQRLRILVTGRVQGVGFRAFVQAAGYHLGLTGWVRNIGDDQVEAVAEGSRVSLEAFARELGWGPSAGRVDKTDLEWGTATGEFHGFNVSASR